MKRIIRLTESDLARIVRRVINEQKINPIAGLPQLTDLYNEILAEFIKIVQPKINSILGTDQFILKPMNDGTQIWFKVENKKNVFKNRNTAQTEDKFKIGDATNAVSNVTKFFKWLENQDVYIEDLQLNIFHNLKLNPYHFNSAVGNFENRFVLKFNNETLGNNDFAFDNVKVYTNESINIIAPNQVIKSIRVHDLLGRVLGTFNNVNSDSFVSKNIAKTQSPLLVEVTLENGVNKTYKVIF